MRFFLLKKVLALLIFQIGILNLILGQELSLEAIYKYPLFVPEMVEGIRSMNDGIHFTILENDSEIVKYSYQTGEREEVIFSILSDSTWNISEISEYQLSENESSILIGTEKESIYRYSYSTDYYAYQFSEQKLIRIFDSGKQQLASISPDGNKVAFVFENNLYTKNIETGELIQITDDGQKNSIINGAPDWVYEEEFTLLTGFLWSADSKKIAYYRFDESMVKDFTILKYDSINAKPYSYKYPVAGEANSKVDIYVYNLETSQHVKMITSHDSDYYVPVIEWLPTSDKISIVTLNRRQNRADVFISDIDSGKSHVLYEEENEEFISEFSEDFVSFIDSGRQALIMSEVSGYMHIYRYKTDGTLINQVTSGNWEVDEILGINEIDQLIYYTATELSPLERPVYSIGFDGKNKAKLTQKRGVHSADFSKTFDYFILTSSDANTPFEFTVYNKENEKIRVLESNGLITNLMKHFNFSDKEFFTFQNKQGDTLYGYKILPPRFKENKKYPMLVFVYGGPETQMVLDQWEKSLPWLQLMAHKGYIIACIDNRGSDGRGEAFKKCTYLHLGKYETEDQIAFVDYMISQGYVDRKRVGVFGWSYGGYMSLLCLIYGNNLFKVGVAVAPVTSWRFYDTVYTERFMRKPDENQEGYDEYSPLVNADKLEGKLFILHGTADDNVHINNSMVLINKLIEADKDFEMQFYPDRNHGISDTNATFHLFQRITDFIIDNL
jgi:dipeptidyl-peptidase 4